MIFLLYFVGTVLLEDVEDVVEPCDPENQNCEEVCISITSTEYVCTGRCHSWEILCNSRLIIDTFTRNKSI